ncbi:MAG: FemAB family PEP-CTERM system-associated protein [Gammaproteobacteria bacterium]|nr:FemAB family PEP-CTERM system-associated protein [Gammaproteobacteria bacterium]
MQAVSEQAKALKSQKNDLEIAILEHFRSDENRNKSEITRGNHAARKYRLSAIKENEISVRRIHESSDEWNKYSDGNPATSIYHRSEWLDLIKSTFGHDCIYLQAIDSKERIVGILPLVYMKSYLFGNFMISVPYFNYGGAVGDHPLIEQHLMTSANEIASTIGSHHIEYRDNVVRDFYPACSRKVSMQLTLPDNQETLWESFPSKLRAQIRRPLRENPEVRIGGLDCLDDFYSVFARNMRDLGTPVYSKDFFRNILNIFPENSKILSVRIHGKPVAACFLLGYREQLEIPWASTIREVNHLSINMLLYWEALKFAISNKYRLFDFGRSTRDSGTFRFKQQWGAKPRQLYWHYWLQEGEKLPELNPDNPKYALAISIWKRLPLFLANRIGPAVVKYLP